MLLGGFIGLEILPVIQLAIVVDPSLILTALLGTVLVFASFAFLALFVVPDEWTLSIGGFLFSSLLVLLAASVLMIFFPPASPEAEDRAEWILIGAGLIVFSGYVAYDTAVIIKRTKDDKFNVLWDATGLFLDFVNIFVRILHALIKLKLEEKSKGGGGKKKD